MPACRKTPADAIVKRSHNILSSSYTVACTVRDLDIKPEVRGNADIDSAPMIPQIIVRGIVLYKPPRSVHFVRPVM